MLEKAYEKVCSEDTKTYFDRIERMIRAYAQPAAGVICFSQQDLDRMPKDFSDRIQAAAESVKGSLTLSEKGIRIDNGFVLSYGGIEENCTLRAVFDMKKDDLTDKVHEMLFNVRRALYVEQQIILLRLRVFARWKCRCFPSL